MDFFVAPMGRLDIPHVIALLKVSDLWFPDDDTPEKLERKLMYDMDLMLVAWSNSRIIGFIMASYDGWAASVWHFCVLPEFRGKGVADRLAREMSERLKRKGADIVYGFVKTDNIRRRKLFEKKYGFSEGLEVVIISKKLGAR